MKERKKKESKNTKLYTFLIFEDLWSVSPLMSTQNETVTYCYLFRKNMNSVQKHFITSNWKETQFARHQTYARLCVCNSHLGAVLYHCSPPSVLLVAFFFFTCFSCSSLVLVVVTMCCAPLLFTCASYVLQFFPLTFYLHSCIVSCRLWIKLCFLPGSKGWHCLLHLSYYPSSVLL